LYLGLLLAHLAHVFEEIAGNFIAIARVGGVGNFLIINWVTFSIPVIIFYFILAGKRWAYFAGIIYAAIMTINGLGHNLAVIFTGKYFGYYAGNFSGIALMVISPILLMSLKRNLPAR
jgi:hypothetical protein